MKEPKAKAHKGGLSLEDMIRYFDNQKIEKIKQFKIANRFFNKHLKSIIPDSWEVYLWDILEGREARVGLHCREDLESPENLKAFIAIKKMITSNRMNNLGFEGRNLWISGDTEFGKHKVHISAHAHKISRCEMSHKKTTYKSARAEGYCKEILGEDYH